MLSVGMLALSSGSAALIATPNAPALIGSPAHSSSSVHMSLSRRAILTSGFAAAAIPLAVSASLVTDEADLKKEESTIADLDAKIQKDRSAAFSDEITLNKKTDAYFEALSKGDKTKATELQKQIKELELKAAAEGAEIRSLTELEAKYVAEEKALKKKVKADEKEEEKEETKELLEAEEAVLKTQVGGETASFVSKFFKQ